MTNSEILKRLLGIQLKLRLVHGTEGERISPSCLPELDEKLVSELRLGGLNARWTVWNPDLLTEMLSDGLRHGLTPEDVLMGSLDDAIYGIRWDIRYTLLLMWLCGIGVVIAVGTIVNHFLKL
jgi:hypothetical protein